MFRKRIITSCGKVLFSSVVLLSLFSLQIAASESDIERNNRLFLSSDTIGYLLDSFGGVDYLSYPDDYGGAYIDEDGYLFIFTTKKDPNDISFRNSEHLTGKQVNYIYGAYSFKDIRKLQAFLDDKIIDLGIKHTGTLDTRNLLEIGLADMNSQDDVLTFLKSNYKEFDESMVVFVLDDKEPYPLLGQSTDANSFPWKKVIVGFGLFGLFAVTLIACNKMLVTSPQ